MELRVFAHSWLSDWNHGNAHFLRGWARALVQRGHRVRLYEDAAGGAGGWSLRHLLQEERGRAAVTQMRAAYPELEVRLYGQGAVQLAAHLGAATPAATWAEELRGSDVVVAHEWNEPALFDLLLEWRRRLGYRLVLYDTHHRAVSAQMTWAGLPVRAFDAVVAFGESLRQLYEREWGARRSYVMHEAADTEWFRARANGADPDHDLVWIGNWGDEERTAELEEFVLGPARQLGRGRVMAYGVRYPAAAQARLAADGVGYGGYLPNLEAPAVYAQAAATVHVPRRPYALALPGIPTIRVFEALACEAALVCAPWRDVEGLFEAGEDYWPGQKGDEMAAYLGQLARNPAQRKHLGARGRARVEQRHTCQHRAREWEAICCDLG